VSIPFTKNSLLLAGKSLQRTEQTLLRADISLQRADVSLPCAYQALCAVEMPIQVSGDATSGNLKWHFKRPQVRLFLTEMRKMEDREAAWVGILDDDVGDEAVNGGSLCFRGESLSSVFLLRVGSSEPIVL